MYLQAAETINEYDYRKTFGLSKRQMLEEPLEDYYLNQYIQRKLNQKEEVDIKKAENKAKMKGKRG